MNLVDKLLAASNNYKGLNIFQEAAARQANSMGYHARRFKILWKSKKCAWNYLFVEWGIRRSDLNQIFPIWNLSHNSQRALMFGFWKLHLTIGYYRAKSFNQNRKLPSSHSRAV